MNFFVLCHSYMHIYIPNERIDLVRQTITGFKWTALSSNDEMRKKVLPMHLQILSAQWEIFTTLNLVNYYLKYHMEDGKVPSCT